MSMAPEFGSDQDIRDLLKEFFGESGPKNKGEAVKLVKEEYGSLVDLKHAHEIISEMYNI